MKEGWKYDQMGNVCTFISGYTPAKELLSKSGSIPYYKVSDMNTEGNEVLLYKTSLYLSNTKKIIPQGSVVFPKNGGAIFTNKKRMLVCDSVVDLNTEAIFPNKNIVTTNFLYKLLLSIDLGQFDNGGGLPSINIKKMQSFTIPIPPLPEQERIVSLLDAEFAKIDAIKANAEKQLQEAKALFQSALKDYLTPKEGWEEKRFGDVCYYQKEQGYWESLRYIGLEHIEPHTGKLLGTIDSNKVESSSFKFDEGVVLYGRLRPYLQKVIIAPFTGCCSTEIFPIKSQIIVNRFLKYWLMSEYVTDIMNNSCTGCRMPRANMNDFKNEKIHYPNKQEQIEIIDNLEIIDQKIKSLQSNFDITVNYCNDLKQSILKDIFS